MATGNKQFPISLNGVLIVSCLYDLDKSKQMKKRANRGSGNV